MLIKLKQDHGLLPHAPYMSTCICMQAAACKCNTMSLLRCLSVEGVPSGALQL